MRDGGIKCASRFGNSSGLKVTAENLAMVSVARSLSDLGDRSEHGGRARPNVDDFEVHSGPTRRKIGDMWAALPSAR